MVKLVTYTLSDADADRINTTQPKRNTATEGDELTAVVVRRWTGDMVNLQVFIDGEGSLWVTSRNRGVGPGTWRD